MPTKQDYGNEIKRRYAVTAYDAIPECATLNSQIRVAYDVLCAFAEKHHVRERQLPALLLRRYESLIRGFDTLVAERDAIANAHRRADNELLCKEYGIEIGKRYYYPAWHTTGIVQMDKEGYIQFIADNPEIWPSTMWRDNIVTLVHTDEIEYPSVRTVVPSSITATTNIPALERARMTATSRK